MVEIHITLVQEEMSTQHLMAKRHSRRIAGRTHRHVDTFVFLAFSNIQGIRMVSGYSSL